MCIIPLGTKIVIITKALRSSSYLESRDCYFKISVDNTSSAELR